MSKALAFLLGAALFLPLRAQAGGGGCDYGLAADVKLDGEAVELRGDAGVYRLENDRLYRDGRPVELDARQRAAADDYRRGLQQLVPAVSEIAVDGAMLGVEAVTLTFAALGGDPDALRRYTRRSEKLAEKVHARFNGRELARGGLGEDAAFDAEIEDLAEDIAGDLSGSIASLVFTALVNPAKAEARADAAERLVERRIEPKADALEAKARPLCARFAKLDALETAIGLDVIVPHADEDGAHRHGYAFSF